MNNLEKLEKNLTKEKIEDLYTTYDKIVKLLENLEKSIKELPPKEEL